MWLLTMFDLPTKTPIERRDYSRFRKMLLQNGFIQLQLSVYAKYSSSRENTIRYCRHIETGVPPFGQVRVIMITDKQFGDMVSLYGEKRQNAERKPEQLLLF